MEEAAPEQLTYTLGTDEVSAHLGLSSRHVRRMARAGILKARQESTRQGRQWFFNEEDVQRLLSIREKMEAKEERHDLAKETFGRAAVDVRGQPGTSEDVSGADLTRASFIQKMLDDERREHAETQRKLEQSQDELREESKKAARLEGEKEGFRLGFQKVIDEQQRFITMLAVKLQLQSPSTSDVDGRVAKDDRGQPGTFADASEVMSEPAEPTPHVMPEPSQDAPHEPSWGKVHGSEPYPPPSGPHPTQNSSQDE